MRKEGTKAQSVKTLPPETTKKVQELLLRMNSHTEYSESDYSYKSNILSGLVSKDGTLLDVSCIVRPVKEIYEGCAKIETEKLVIEINPKNGEILMAKKPLFQSWAKAYHKLEKFLDRLSSNFDNAEAVERRLLPMSGLTECGVEKVREESAKIIRLDKEKSL